MSENIKMNERCIKGNTAYFKIKINNMIKYEINKLGANESSYEKFNYEISDSFFKFTNKMISGSNFDLVMTNLRDEIISGCVEIDNDPASKMRPFFKDYIFDKVYTMGINIKNGLLPDDYEQELEAERMKIEEDQQRDLEEKEKSENDIENRNEITVTVEDAEEKSTDIVDQMWDYFFGNSKSNDSKEDKKPEKQKENKEDKIIEE